MKYHSEYNFEYKICPMIVSWTTEVKKWTESEIGLENFEVYLDIDNSMFRTMSFKYKKDAVRWKLKWIK
jgi:ribosomal protein L24E